MSVMSYPRSWLAGAWVGGNTFWFCQKNYECIGHNLNHNPSSFTKIFSTVKLSLWRWEQNKEHLEPVFVLFVCLLFGKSSSLLRFLEGTEAVTRKKAFWFWSPTISYSIEHTRHRAIFLGKTLVYTAHEGTLAGLMDQECASFQKEISLCSTQG